MIDPGYSLDSSRRARDTLGRSVPRRMDLPLMFEAVPGLAEQFSTRVPHAYWAEESDESGQVAVIACPCGGTPRVPSLQVASCNCNRFFIWVHGEVRVAFGEERPSSTLPSGDGDEPT